MQQPFVVQLAVLARCLCSSLSRKMSVRIVRWPTSSRSLLLLPSWTNWMLLFSPRSSRILKTDPCVCTQAGRKVGTVCHPVARYLGLCLQNGWKCPKRIYIYSIVCKQTQVRACHKWSACYLEDWILPHERNSGKCLHSHSFSFLLKSP